MRKTALVIGAAAVLGLSAALAVPAAQAHHSAVQFDFTKAVDIKGTVEKFELINPHMRLVMKVSDAKGTRDIEFEGHSRNNMYRNGWRPDMVKPGDPITVTIAPLKNGADGGFVQAVTTKDGRHFGMTPAAQRR